MQILFEDSRIIALNKPSGVPSNRLAQSSVPLESIEEQISQLYAQNSTQKETYLLHRLDVGTSGVLLFARDVETFENMRRLFKERKIRKYYSAWSRVDLSSQLELPCEITNSLAHHAKSKKRMIVVDPVTMAKRPQTFYRGEAFPALTRIHAITPDSEKFKNAFRYDVEIETGVTHQIRIHLKHKGAPLIGDPIYNASVSEIPVAETENETGVERLALHARRIEFTLGDYLYQIEAPAP